MPKSGKKRSPDDEMVLSVRVKHSLLADLDVEAKRYFPSAELSRSQLIKMALHDWVESQKAHHGDK